MVFFAVTGPRRLVVLMSDSDLLKARQLAVPDRWHEAPAQRASPLAPPRWACPWGLPTLFPHRRGGSTASPGQAGWRWVIRQRR